MLQNFSYFETFFYDFLAFSCQMGSFYEEQKNFIKHRTARVCNKTFKQSTRWDANATA